MKQTLLGLLTAVLVLVAATAICLGLIHLTDQPYLIDLGALNIPERAGITREDALLNYRAVMDYLSPFSKSEFELPTLVWSADGADHFADCKRIFNGLYLLGAVCTAAVTFLAVRGKLRNARLLRVSGAATLAIPLAVMAAVAIDFDRAFVLFHTVFFPGKSNWLFDYDTDPVINILPETFFLHCALVIALGWVIASAVQLAAASRIKKQNKENN